MKTKCPCQNCSSQLEFETDELQPETRVECPHCHMETLLFVPSVTNQSPIREGLKPKRAWFRRPAFVVPVILLLFALIGWSALRAIVIAQYKEEGVLPTFQTKDLASLKPVEGAFGYKLGDKVPKEIDGLETADLNMCPIHPNPEVPPFTSEYVEYLSDGRIYGITASVKLEHKYEVREAKDQLMTTLTEKYGLRETGKLLGSDAYHFGTEQRGACLQISDDNWVKLEYYDNSLRTISLNEFRAKEQKEKADQKASLGKNL
jgi:DNA-directed RNA polymerase subunit RPC12/RpoP